MMNVDVSSIPLSLRRLAFLWLLVGTLSAVGGLVLYLDFGLGPIDIGTLGLAFGPGLVLGWRWVQVAIRWISWIAIVITILLLISTLPFGNAWAWVTAVVLTCVILLLLEQVYILKLPAVRRYYESLLLAEAAAKAGAHEA
jgi:hypothetical protein